MGALLLVLAALIGGVAMAAPWSASGDTTATSSFSKTGTDATTGSSVTSGGAAGTTQAGDTINWVLHYQNNEASAVTASLADTLGANQTLISGSIQKPPGWTCGFPLNLTTCGGPLPANRKFQVNGAVPAGTPAASTGISAGSSISEPGGDGYSVEGAGDNVYTVFHHNNSSTVVFCATVEGAACSGWPRTGVSFVDPTPGTPLGQGTSGAYTTANDNGSFIVGGKLYWAVQATSAVSGSYPVGVQCLDLSSLTSCGFTQLDTVTQAPDAATHVGQVATDGTAASDGHYYLFDQRGNLLCFDPATGGCGVTNIAGGITGINPAAQGPTGDVLTDGNYVYVTFLDSGGPSHVHLTCFDVSHAGLCAPSFPIDEGTAVSGIYPDIVAPVLSAAGAFEGACSVAKGKCLTPAGATLSNPYVGITGFGGSHTAPVGQGSGQVSGARFYIGDISTSKIDCFDFSAWSGSGAVPRCAGFSGPSDTRNYTVRALANRPGCLAADGDGGIIVLFNAKTGVVGCPTAEASLTATPSASYCDGQSGHIQGWNKLSLSGANGAAYTSASVTITDANGNPVPGFQNVPLAPGQTSLDISSIPVTGSTATLTATVAVQGVTSGSAFGSPSIILSWKGDPIEVCLKTKVSAGLCNATPAVSNSAVATTFPIGGGASDGGNSSGTATFTEAADASQCVDLAVTKTGPALAPPGGSLLWSLVVTNNGPMASTGYTVTDTLPTGVTNIASSTAGCSVSGQTVTCTGGALPNGQSATYAITADAPSPFTAPITNTATVTGKDADANTGNNSSSATTGSAAPSVSLVKQGAVTPAADQGGVKVGDQIAYTYTVTNIGNDTLPSVAVSDPTIGSVTCPAPVAPGLAPTASETCTADQLHVVTQTDVDHGGVTDTATATGTDTFRQVSPQSNPSTVTIPALPESESVSLQKVADASGGDTNPIAVGETIKYSYVVTNSGNVTLAAVAAADPTGGNVTCPSLTAPGLAPGQSITCTGDTPHTVTQADVDAGSVSDTATAAGTDTHGKPSPPSAPSTVTVPSKPSPTVSLDKHATVSPASDQDGVKAGDTIAYTYTVTNTGNVDLASIAVSDPTIGTVSCPAPAAGGLAPGQSETCAARSTHTVTQAEVDTGKVSDTATATGTDGKGQTSPQSAPSTVIVPARVEAAVANRGPRVGLVKTATVSPGADQRHAKQGDRISYALTVTNLGGVELTRIQVSDPSLGPVDCPRPAAPGLAPGKSETCTARDRHTVTSADVKAGSVKNTATATGTDPSGRTSPSARASATVLTATSASSPTRGSRPSSQSSSEAPPAPPSPITNSEVPVTG